MKNPLISCFVWLLVTLLSPGVVAQEGSAPAGVITLEGARIRGGQEAPLVLYLVPWQPPEAKSLNRPDEELMLARPIGMLERAEFKRLIGYHQHFQAIEKADNAPENSGSGQE